MTSPAGQADHSARSHFVRSPADWIAGCSDIGLRHSTNQDAMALAARSNNGRNAVIAVADGVSTAHGAEAASVAASEAAIAHLTSESFEEAEVSSALVQAFENANDAVISIAGDEEPSACTLVVAVIDPRTVVIGSVGDSRVYWIGDDESCQLLTTDDSMAQARILLGMSRVEAEQSSQAHSITKWLGRDAANVTPSISTLEPAAAGWLLVCSDGLWNYASSPTDMFDVFVAARSTAANPSELSESLVEWARTQGGRDNITAAVARIEHS